MPSASSIDCEKLISNFMGATKLEAFKRKREGGEGEERGGEGAK